MEGGQQGGLRSVAESIRRAGSLVGIVKYAANRSGNRFVVGREAWKGLLVSKLMYGAGALKWNGEDRKRAEGCRKNSVDGCGELVRG